MKKIVAILVLFASQDLLATPLAYTRLFLTVQSGSPTEIDLKGNLELKSWCRGLSSALDIYDFQSARKIEELRNGLYSCTGEFVHQRGTRTIQILKIQSCESLEPSTIECSTSVGILPK